MRGMHQYLGKVSFDVYELALFQLVVKHRSFTKAAEVAGLTQSAVTRQIQGVENSLGILLLERTTRAVRLTPAGEFLFQEGSRIVGDVERSLQHLAEQFAGARKEIRVAVSRTIALAYLPGFFHANLRRLSGVGYHVSHRPGIEILSAIENGEQDVGVLAPPRRLPKTIRVTHRFQDAFTLIASREKEAEVRALTKSAARIDWLRRQNWLLIEKESDTGAQIQNWLRRSSLKIDPAMRLDNFDLIINLAALGMGISLVPIRALALYNQRQKIIRIPMPTRFTRELVVVVRKHRKMPDHLTAFIDNVLF